MTTNYLPLNNTPKIGIIRDIIHRTSQVGEIALLQIIIDLADGQSTTAVLSPKLSNCFASAWGIELSKWFGQEVSVLKKADQSFLSIYPLIG